MNENAANTPEWLPGLSEWEAQIKTAVGSVLSTLTERTVQVEVSEPRPFKQDEIINLFPEGVVAVTVDFNESKYGAWHFFIPPNLASVLADSSVTPDSPGEFDIASQGNELNDMIAQVVVTCAPELSELIGRDIQIEAPIISTDPTELMRRLKDLPTVNWNLEISDWGSSILVKVLEFKAIEDDVEPEPEFANSAVNDYDDDERDETSELDDEAPTVRSARYVDFDENEAAPSGGSPRNMDMLLDISLPITIELGRTSMLVRDILELGPGSVIELDKLSGEPVDLFVNDKMFAKGEVVVIEENFGIRITELLKVDERLKGLQ